MSETAVINVESNTAIGVLNVAIARIRYLHETTRVDVMTFDYRKGIWHGSIIVESLTDEELEEYESQDEWRL